MNRLPRIGFRLARILLSGLVLSVLAACATLLPSEPPRVDVVGIEPLTGQGMELRMLVKLRVINPNDTPIEYNGVFVDVEVRDRRFASGVSDARGSVPRFGEALLTVPVTIPALSVLRQAWGFAQDDRSPITYVVRGRLSGPVWDSHSFSSEGELRLPVSPGSSPR
ncbi:MAG TPA: LEA type 2 family protein [Hydrogenophaga sp.]|uniref:LEA type 2 family protein n=1 Tax=Hydrogenophaga sp. TaxID=1904254 RepID=UPI002C8E02B9|nr:LEA type 2 family protein [Hydrogenophaga sp.]HMN94475.1 LEA type 2 family protein [Hydrogenophaga sp.]HMP11155.1 LEA type 2 family protein [Hydrogenophaga sp.]